MRPTTFIISVITAALFMTVFALILANAHDKYNLTAEGYNSTNLEVFQKLDEMQNISEQIKVRVQNKSDDRSLLDIVGSTYLDAKDTVTIGMKIHAATANTLLFLMNSSTSIISITLQL